MKTCGNCGTRCTGRTGPRDRAACADWTVYEPTELQRAQWWFVAWRRAFVRRGLYRAFNRLMVMDRKPITEKRLFKVLRANAGKGSHEQA